MIFSIMRSRRIDRSGSEPGNSKTIISSRSFFKANRASSIVNPVLLFPPYPLIWGSDGGNSNPLDRGCVYRILDSAWTQRTDGVSSRPDEGSSQADSRRPGFALQVESKAGSRNPDPAATDQCASPAGTETTAPQQYRSFSVCLALSLVPLRPWRDSDYQARDNHSLAPRWISSVLALAIAQPCWQTEGLG